MNNVNGNTPGAGVSGAYALITADANGKTTVQSGRFGDAAGGGLDGIGRNANAPSSHTYGDDCGAANPPMSRQAQQAALMDFIGRLCQAIGALAGQGAQDAGQDANDGYDDDDDDEARGGDRARSPYDDRANQSGSQDYGPPRLGNDAHGPAAALDGAYGPSRPSGGSRVPAQGDGGGADRGGYLGQGRNAGSSDASHPSGESSQGCSSARGTSAGRSGDSQGVGPVGGKPAGTGGTDTWKHGNDMNGAVKRYDNTGSAESKQRVNAALNQAGASTREKALIMAMGMQEDQNFKNRDTAKDGGGDARNFSAFNLNKYQLRQLGYKGDLERLNDPKNVGEVSTLLLKGLRDPNMGVVRLMNLTRGGQSAENGGGDQADLAKWRNGQMASANAMLAAGPQAFTDSARYVCEAGYR